MARSENYTAAGLEVLRRHYGRLLELDHSSVLSRLSIRDRARGEQLFAAGEQANSLYIVVKGSFAVHKPVGIGNRTQAVALLSVGALAGEAALLTGGERGAAMIAVEDSKVLELTREILDDIEHNSPELYMALLKKTLEVVSKRLKKSSERLALIL